LHPFLLVSGGGAVCPLHDFAILSVAVFRCSEEPALSLPKGSLA
jgi:hypothetical protein